MITNVSYFKANFAMILSSSSLNTFPVGFDGLHRIIAFGFCLKAFSKTFTSKLKLDNVSAQLKKPRANIVKNIVPTFKAFCLQSFELHYNHIRLAGCVFSFLDYCPIYLQ